MILEDINRQLDRLYCTDDLKDGVSIGTWYTIEGDPINFIFYQEDEKYARIVTNASFSEWMAWCTNGWRKKAPVIERLAAFYGVQWDNEEGRLFIRFRRNEVSIAQAILRLQQAVFVVSSFDYH